MSPPPRQNIQQVDGVGSSIHEYPDDVLSSTEQLYHLPQDGQLNVLDPGLETGEKTPDHTAFIAEHGVESQGVRVPAAGRAAAGEPQELRFFGPHSENVFK